MYIYIIYIYKKKKKNRKYTIVVKKYIENTERKSQRKNKAHLTYVEIGQGGHNRIVLVRHSLSFKFVPFKM